MAFPTIDGTNSYASSTNAANHTVPLPAVGVAAGKLLAIAMETGGGTATAPTAAGWTVVGDGLANWATAGAVTMRLAWKIATGSDVDPDWTMNAGANVPLGAFSLVIGGIDDTAPIDDTDAFENNDSTTATSVVIPALTTLDADRLIIRFAAKSNAADTTWDGNSTELDEITTSTTVRSLSLASATQAAAGTTPSSTASSGTAGHFGGVAIAIASVAGPPPVQENIEPRVFMVDYGGAY